MGALENTVLVSIHSEVFNDQESRAEYNHLSINMVNNDGYYWIKRLSQPEPEIAEYTRGRWFIHGQQQNVTEDIRIIGLVDHSIRIKTIQPVSIKTTINFAYQDFVVKKSVDEIALKMTQRDPNPILYQITTATITPETYCYNSMLKVFEQYSLRVEPALTRLINSLESFTVLVDGHTRFIAAHVAKKQSILSFKHVDVDPTDFNYLYAWRNVRYI